MVVEWTYVTKIVTIASILSSSTIYSAIHILFLPHMMTDWIVDHLSDRKKWKIKMTFMSFVMQVFLLLHGPATIIFLTDGGFENEYMHMILFSGFIFYCTLYLFYDTVFGFEFIFGSHSEKAKPDYGKILHHVSLLAGFITSPWIAYGNKDIMILFWWIGLGSILFGPLLERARYQYIVADTNSEKAKFAGWKFVIALIRWWVWNLIFPFIYFITCFDKIESKFRFAGLVILFSGPDAFYSQGILYQIYIRKSRLAISTQGRPNFEFSEGEQIFVSETEICAKT